MAQMGVKMPINTETKNLDQRGQTTEGKQLSPPKPNISFHLLTAANGSLHIPNIEKTPSSTDFLFQK